MTANWETRWHPLLAKWTVISARSALRPWSGAEVPQTDAEKVEYDPSCYLCPRVERASGQLNPDYVGPFAFDNDFPSLSLDAPTPSGNYNDSPLQLRAAAHGICRVLCWSEKHNTTLADVPPDTMRAVAQLWKSEYATLSQHAQISHVLIFENKGTEIGVSNLHPHGQVYASGFVTDAALTMRESQHQYSLDYNSQSLLQDLVKRDEYQNDLLVEESTYFKTIVPFAAQLPFETWIIPTRHVSAIDQFNNDELDDLAAMYQRQAKRYDTLFQRSSPNITLLHNAPCDNHHTNDDWCFHIAMQPPLRDRNKLKYMAGFESGSNNVVNPVQPESAAAALRECDITGNST